MHLGNRYYFTDTRALIFGRRSAPLFYFELATQEEIIRVLLITI